MKAYIIAEAGLCHNGDVEIAKRLIDMAIKCKANAIKFQKRTVSQMVTKDVLDKPFMDFPSFGKTYREIREHLELSKEEYQELREYKRNKIDFIVTPFDIQSVEFLDDLDLDGIKLAAHSLTDYPLLVEVAKRNVPIYISTGMAYTQNIKDAVGVLGKRRTKKDKYPLTIMHCSSQYPVEPKNMNLRFIKILKDLYPQYIIGFSDHQFGVSIAPVAVAMGAEVFEKHITLNHSFEGFDHAMSLEPSQLKEYVQNIRDAEKALRYHYKKPMDNESECFNNYRRTVVALRDIKEGETFTDNMITTKAPNVGISPFFIPKLLTMKAKVDISQDTHIMWSMTEKLK
ncbi:MAG: N-acetylneuraminate synthase family protein [Halanaerobiales bacterium]|nr:N-acetylneuraminate synthase family protein [Halanaerobiales bacterium]